MESIKKIPIFGYLLRILFGIIKLPKHLERLYQEREVLQQEQELVKKEQQELKNIQENLQHILTEVQQWKNTQQETIEELRRWNMDRMENIRGVQDRVSRLENLNVDAKYMKKLTLLCSLNPTIWGDDSRLHISDLASVSACMFNTNSGHITIGDYTFAGSGVSILAGSHDMQLTGLLRRDAEMIEGCDIEIGNGVWLASNSTILGPAKIGDNAVIAAGAVVIPGTVVPDNTIYGGVPAKCIGKIPEEEMSDIWNSAVLRALERNNDCLYAKGWTEKRSVLYKNEKYIGHYQVENVAQIYFKQKKYKAFYQFRHTDECTIFVKVDSGEEVPYHLLESSGTIEIMVDNINQEIMMPHVICIRKKTKDAELFISTMES